jgi:tRNA pseudouridine38-40 synthase
VRIDLAYDGTDFAGWATQPGRRTVQGVLTDALATVLRTAGQGSGSGSGEGPRLGPAVVVAGRTDAGVHARGQVCHVDVPRALLEQQPGRSALSPPQALQRRLNGVLEPDVRVHGVVVAPAGFDARFSAVHRRYAYRLTDAAAGAPPLRRRDVVAHRGRLDVEAMDRASGALVGLHDFAAFCKRRDGATTVRALREYSWQRVRTAEGEELVVARVVADAFCHSMVRALVGGALAVGDGRRPPSWLADVLAGRSRDPAVVVAPAHGLVLEEVGYPADGDLAARAAAARAVRVLPDS